MLRHDLDVDGANTFNDDCTRLYYSLAARESACKRIKNSFKKKSNDRSSR